MFPNSLAIRIASAAISVVMSATVFAYAIIPASPDIASLAATPIVGAFA